MKEFKLSEIIIYPVKSCKGISLESLLVTNKGLHMDRRWMIVDESGMFISQRTMPELATIYTGLDDRFLFLSVPGVSPFMLPQSPKGKPCEVKIWQRTCQAIDMGQDAAEWLSAYLQIPCRLVFLPEYAEQDMGFADRMPVLLISESSLQDLNGRVSMRLRMNRFRPNLVVAGCTPFEEDGWKRIQIGDVIFRIEKPCIRSIVPAINQETVEKSNEPLEALASYRKDENGVSFGQLLVQESTGTISKNGSIKILE